MTLLSWIAPPLVGAVIGYVTNHVAIRMLFRPLRPWRLFGLRLPMTPGVIPARRHQLAENIGEMVGEHLLTSEDVRLALTQEGFQRELQQVLDARIETIMARDLGPVASVVPERFRASFKAGIRILRWRLLKHLHAHLESEEVTRILSEAIAASLDRSLEREVGSCLAGDGRQQLHALLAEALHRFLNDPALHAMVRELADRRLDAFVRQGASLRDLLPESLAARLLDALAAQTPKLLEQMAALLEGPATRERLARAIGEALQKFAASLGPMAALLSGFVTPELISEKIRACLAEKGPDIGGWLLDEAVQEKMAGLLREQAGRLLDTPLATLLARVEPATREKAGQWLGDLAVSALRNPATARTAMELLADALAGREKDSLAVFAGELFGEEGLARGREWATREIISLLRAPKTKRLLDTLLVELLEARLLAGPIGPLATFLPKAVQHGISDYLLQQTSALLIREVPGLVDSLGIRQIVARKVDSLDLLRLEGLLLSIMQEQFKYINLFGALLGFVIGLLNLLFFLP